ncbi:MAG: nuclear transport factor 2 family protein [Alphaproteobacteria bacterium]|nr:nuclear transport factor 2 family protein [Alphaproteobacteria bacterium]
MDIADKLACSELVQAWGFARDQGKWDDLLAIFHPGGEIAVSWFRGPYPEFVAHCRNNFGKGTLAKHQLWPVRVTLNGSRALAETSVAILVRQTIDGIAVDLTSQGRFLDRIEKRDGAWRMVERAALYEKDRLDPVEPSPAFAAMLAKADTAKFPAPYRYMAYRVEAAGRTLAEPVHYDGRAETEALKVRYAEWLKGG